MKNGQTKEKSQFIVAIVVIILVAVAVSIVLYIIYGYKLQASFLTFCILTGLGIVIYSINRVFHPDIAFIPLTKDDLDEPEEREIVLKLPFKQAFDRCMESLPLLDNAKIDTVDRKKDVIEVKTPRPSFISWGYDQRQSIVTF